MNEFKVTNALDGEIESLKKAGNNLNQNSASTGTDGLSLNCCDLYVEQEKEIARLLNLYKALVVKDAEDLAKMAASVREIDKKISEY